MNIKVGFVHNGREIVIDCDKPQAELIEECELFLESNDKATLILEGTQGNRVLLVRDKVAYIEFGASKKSAVGFSH